MKIHARYFSQDEINALIPELEGIFVRFSEKKDERDRMHDFLLIEELLKDATAGMIAPDHIDTEAMKVDQAIVEMEHEIKKITSLGCIIRSLEHGMVDFPAEKDGEKIYFSWRCGEKAVSFWRAAHVPFSQRLPL